MLPVAGHIARSSLMATERQAPGVNGALVPVSPLCVLLAREAASAG